jgi:hypothetical protein
MIETDAWNACRTIVGIPVHNEEDCIAALLRSFAAQTGCGRFAVVLLLNNCTDRTRAIVETMAPALPFTVHPIVRRLGPDRANAGTARRLAMREAARLAPANGVLLSTDADSVLPPNWIAANLAALRAGADAVAGRAVIDPDDEAALPAQMVADEERVQLLTTLLDRIDWLIDPDPADSWPRHTEESGASIAVTKAAFTRIGGIPAMKLGEDRAFFAALKREDARIRHAPEIAVTVSGRLHGRAKGGMADTMRRRMTQPDTFLDDNIEPAHSRMVRAYLRSAVRLAWSSQDRRRLPRSLCLPTRQLDVAMGSHSFGLAWHQIETTSPVLRRLAVPNGEREIEIIRAQRIVTSLSATRSKTLAPALLLARAANDADTPEQNRGTA